MNELKISIIIPVYNSDKYLKECLNSVINQTLKEIEIICVNDGSTDKSLEILNQYSSKDKRIIIINKKNGGAGSARNLGIEKANGEYIIFLDSDDWIDTKTCECLYLKAKHDQTDLIIFKMINYDDNSQKFYKTDYYDLLSVKEFFKDSIYTWNDFKDKIFYLAVSPVNKLYKKDLIDTTGAKFIEGLIFEDNPFFFNIILNAKRVLLYDEYFYFRRRSENSVMSSIDEKHFDIIPITNLIIQIFKENNFFTIFKKNVLNKKITLIKHEYNKFEGKNRSKFFKLVKDDFNVIRKNENLNEDYKNSLIPRNLDFYINSQKTEDFREFDLLNENSYLTSRVRTLENNYENMKLGKDKLKNKNKKLLDKNRNLKDNNIEIKNQNIELKKELEKIYSSTSWKITKPMRKLMKKFR
ncbi:putative glycosyltransferase EpsJ [Methanobrevibacter cuticularis]|uniref:Putative glycosyltransferase EpsJ n=1 Tax=Methanobrevibacter cuticularis TaxID=47311 RepID=A0A166DX42_9EURY|nr:glycosyltransferase family 2 protein [Methanobrevibacter cuticularis]KZX16044.1 putative glycosyltransferase EpsJ [Methanobrevibacter cuticularis]